MTHSIDTQSCTHINSFSKHTRMESDQDNIPLTKKASLISTTSTKLQKATQNIISSKKEIFNKISEAVHEAIENKDEIGDDLGALDDLAPVTFGSSKKKNKAPASRLSYVNLKSKLFKNNAPKGLKNTGASNDEESMFHVAKPADMRRKSIQSLSMMSQEDLECSLEIEVVTSEHKDLVIDGGQEIRDVLAAFNEKEEEIVSISEQPNNSLFANFCFKIKN